jgi:Copper type II ascorbate-dependent monooxygenase, C-terminal domain
MRRRELRSIQPSEARNIGWPSLGGSALSEEVFMSVVYPARCAAGFLICVALAGGCGPTLEEVTGATATSGANGGPTAGTGGSATSGAGGSGGFDPGGMRSTVSTSMGPIAAAAGTETTQCIVVSLKNANGAFVRRFRADLGTGSHHLIAYRSNATQEDLTPKDCNGFSGLFSGEHPIFIAQQAKSELVFPTDKSGVPVGFEIVPNQMVRLEMHYINTTDKPLDVTGKIYLDTVPLSTNVIKSDLAFWGTQDFSIPPNASFETAVKFQRALAGSKTFALTTHQHRLGTQMRVWYGNSASDTSMVVADSKNWSDPPLELFSTPLEFPASSSGGLSDKGFAYQCAWKNTTAKTVTLGEGFNDEMCFLWHYYYPSQGFQICFDGLCKKVK